MAPREASGRDSEDQRERLLRVLSAATFLIFFQAYIVASLIPRLAAVFAVSSQTIGVLIFDVSLGSPLWRLCCCHLAMT